MARSDAPACCQRLLQLPDELVLRVLEEVNGKDLGAVEAAHPLLRRTVAANGYLYERALAQELGVNSTTSSCSEPKREYVQKLVQQRVDSLNRQQCVYNTLKMRLDELDGLLEQADEVRALLDAPELLLAQPSLVLDMVGDMEQDVLQQRWDAAGDLLAAESVMLAMQRDVAELLSRVPSSWRCWPALEDSAGSPQPASPSVGCTIA